MAFFNERLWSFTAYIIHTIQCTDCYYFLATFSMEGGGARTAAVSAAVLGSRNARRQVQAVLAHAAEFGAYSVGFQLGRGRLDGFTIYLAGNFAGCGALRSSHSMAAACAMQPPSTRSRAAGHAQPKARAAAERGPQSTQHAGDNVAQKRVVTPPASVPQGGVICKRVVRLASAAAERECDAARDAVPAVTRRRWRRQMLHAYMLMGAAVVQW